MKQTKSELDEDNLDGYSLKESSDQDQFKAVQKLINNNNQSYLQQWILVGSLKN